jgi:hypothetical protein
MPTFKWHHIATGKSITLVCTLTNGKVCVRDEDGNRLYLSKSDLAAEYKAATLHWQGR